PGAGFILLSGLARLMERGDVVAALEGAVGDIDVGLTSRCSDGRGRCRRPRRYVFGSLCSRRHGEQAKRERTERNEAACPCAHGVGSGRRRSPATTVIVVAIESRSSRRKSP